MLDVICKIKAEDIVGSNFSVLEELLDKKFFVNYPDPNNENLIHNEFTYKDRIKLDKFGREMEKNCPEELGFSLFFIRDYTVSYYNGNHTGRFCLYHLWPLFFRKFPLGQIWLINTPKKWNNEIWLGQRTLAHEMGYLKNNPNGYSPQEMSGLNTDEFHLNALNILSYGIYPLISCLSTSTVFELTILYIPDRSFKHSQMTEANTLYTRILWEMHGLFDDQWTFDGSRGPKCSIEPSLMNPINQLDYFGWLIEKIDSRMEDILEIEDYLLREKLVMTINRAIFDAQMSVISELPYISMIFFFNFLDKIANLLVLLNIEKNEAVAWLKFFEEDFIREILQKNTINIPNKVGTYLNDIVNIFLNELEYGDLSPGYMRDIRNTNHGYNIKEKSVERIMQKDGEINNNIPLISTAIIIYIISIKWKI
jgi:hypothetical protein